MWVNLIEDEGRELEVPRFGVNYVDDPTGDVDDTDVKVVEVCRVSAGHLFDHRAEAGVQEHFDIAENVHFYRKSEKVWRTDPFS